MARIVNRREPSGTTYLYVMTCGEYCKVGMAVDVEARLATLQCGNPYEMHIHAGHAALTVFANACEKHAHSILAKYHHGKEWYCVSPELAEQAVIDAIREKNRPEQRTEKQKAADIARAIRHRDACITLEELDQEPFDPESLRVCANALEL